MRSIRKLIEGTGRYFDAAGAGAARAALHQFDLPAGYDGANSRLARIGRRMVQGAFLMRSIEALLVIVCVLGVAVVETYAQAPRGSLFGGTDQQIGNGVRSALYWARNLLFAMGIFFGFMVPVRIYMNKGWGTAVVACAGAFGIAGLLAWAYSISQGTTVNFNSDYS